MKKKVKIFLPLAYDYSLADECLFFWALKSISCLESFKVVVINPYAFHNINYPLECIFNTSKLSNKTVEEIFSLLARYNENLGYLSDSTQFDKSNFSKIKLHTFSKIFPYNNLKQYDVKLDAPPFFYSQFDKLMFIHALQSSKIILDFAISKSNVFIKFKKIHVNKICDLMGIFARYYIDLKPLIQLYNSNTKYQPLEMDYLMPVEAILPATMKDILNYYSSIG